MRYSVYCALALSLPAWVGAQVAIPKLSAPVPVYGSEADDYQVAPTKTPKAPPMHAPTPTSLPGARTIRTMELKALLDADKRVVLVDVLSSSVANKSLPGAQAMAWAAAASLKGKDWVSFNGAMERITGGDDSRPVVFFCANSYCWMSYNAALHALEAGYKDVLWYRGGIYSWQEAHLPLRSAKLVN